MTMIAKEKVMALNGALTHGQASIVWNAVVVLTTNVYANIAVDDPFKSYHLIHIYFNLIIPVQVCF